MGPRPTFAVWIGDKHPEYEQGEQGEQGGLDAKRTGRLVGSKKANGMLRVMVMIDCPGRDVSAISTSVKGRYSFITVLGAFSVHEESRYFY